MFLHIGRNCSIPTKDIVAIIDTETSFVSEDTKRFLERMKKEGNFYKYDDEVKTYIITLRKEFDKKTRQFVNKEVIYTSDISSTTLLKRSYENRNFN